jgi:hypothetical protein
LFIFLNSLLVLGDFIKESCASLAFTPSSIDKSPQLSLSKLEEVSLYNLDFLIWLKLGDFAASLIKPN